MFGGYLYFHRCPSAAEHQRECVRKLKGLHKWDNLRANKSTAAWGVEARVPFLDREFLDHAMGHVSPADKLCGRAADPPGRIEKWVLREAFRGYLPEEILWRQKEQFSDGVGYGWIDSLKAHAEKQVTDAELAAAHHRFPYNTPATKEAFFFRSIFDKHFPQQSARGQSEQPQRSDDSRLRDLGGLLPRTERVKSGAPDWSCAWADSRCVSVTPYSADVVHVQSACLVDHRSRVRPRRRCCGTRRSRRSQTAAGAASRACTPPHTTTTADNRQRASTSKARRSHRLPPRTQMPNSLN